jgi:error-prone DNA polymerase
VQKLDAVLNSSTIQEDPLALPAPTEGQGILADYRSLGLTLGRHPLALLRHRLAKPGVRPADQLLRVPSGHSVRVAGIVTHRKRPETAYGVVFAALEDETGTANLVIWAKVLEAQREVALGDMLLVQRTAAGRAGRLSCYR